MKKMYNRKLCESLQNITTVYTEHVHTKKFPSLFQEIVLYQFYQLGTSTLCEKNFEVPIYDGIAFEEMNIIIPELNIVIPIHNCSLLTNTGRIGTFIIIIM